MKRLGSVSVVAALGAAAVAALVPGCGGGGAKVTGLTDNGDGGGPPDFAIGSVPDDLSANQDLAAQCSGLDCQQVNCGELNPPTTLTGTVFAPNGTLPLYNAIVYVPNATPEPFKQGLTCDRCDGHVTGKPLVLQQTGSDGRFELKNVPAGLNIPLVIQIGKWRRQVTIPSVPACQITKVPAELSRLAKNRKEGDLPEIAVATGSADPMECLLLKMGIDPKEFRNPGMGGRVEIYQAAGAPGLKIDMSTPRADDKIKGLYATPAQLQFYDIVLLPCEGQEFDQNVGTKNIVDYVNAGGRVFATHYSYDWLTYRDSPFNRISNPLFENMDGKGKWQGWHKNAGAGNTTSATLITDFPKGRAFKDWLMKAGAKSPPGTLTINDIRYDIDTVDKKLAQPWASTDNNGIHHSQLTFNTPLDATKDDAGVRQYCGRVVFSDFHVAASEANFGQPFPAACKGGPMSDQEMALAFMIFDLSSCVQPDDEIPIT